MKKSTIFLLIIVYVVSVLVVGFFGASIRPSNVYNYVESIEFVDPTNSVLTPVPTAKGGTYGFTCEYIDNGSAGYTVSLKAIVKPDNANNKDVYFYYDTQKSSEYTVNVSPEDKTIINITIYSRGTLAEGFAQSTDGKQLTVKFMILAL